MQKAVLISLGAHGLAMLLVFVSVTFRQVRYIPRETYRVRLVSAASMATAPAAAASAAKPSPPAPTPPKEEPKQEEPKKDELALPAEKPKPKPQPKAEQPSKQEEKPADAVPRADLTKSDTTGTEAGGGEGGSPTSGPPGPGDAISFDGGDFPYSAYVARMRSKIAAAWQLPAGNQTVQRSALIYFRIHADGDITHVAVEQSSGVFLFDQSCQRAVIESAPLAPLPREYMGEYLGVHFTFRFTPSVNQ